MLKISENPLISYVIGVRNMASTVGNTIKSILNQDYPNKEIIVINDGSDDDTEEVLKKYPIKFITTDKSGISNARNLGYRNSNGEFIAFTDADCVLDPLWTRNMLKGFEDDRVGLVGGVTEFRTDGSYSSIYRSIEFSKRYKNIKSNEVVWAGGPGSMFKRRVLDEIGGFNPKWIHGEDAEISFMTIEHGYKVRKQDDALTYHIPESGFKKLVKKGLRDAKAYVRVTKSHLKTSFKNKFNTTWYFPYDLIILPFFYAFIIISGILLPLFYLINKILYLIVVLESIWIVWVYLIILIGLFLFIYGLIPIIQVTLTCESKKLKNFFRTLFLHHIRGLAWGLGLIIGIKNIISNKK